MRALLCLTLFTLGCYSAPLPTPADDVTDGSADGVGDAQLFKHSSESQNDISQGW